VLVRSNLEWRLFVQNLSAGAGIRFAIALVSILLVHEMGHFLAGRRRNIATSWPYFIPAPNLFGTFGAVIISKSPFWNRRDLLELGAAGPIAGWVVAFGFLAYGLTQSQVVPIGQITPYDFPFTLEGESILMRLLTGFFVGPAPDGSVYLLSEFAFAGWAGLLVTALNLIPIGQFDGGHILYGLLGRRQHAFAWVALVALAVLGFFSPMWWVFAVLGFVFRVEHPPTLNDIQPPDRPAVVMGIVSLIILVLSFTPMPIR
jgi:membrane-associated protease RseP (regulator of RpoE activity)